MVTNRYHSDHTDNAHAVTNLVIRTKLWLNSSICTFLPLFMGSNLPLVFKTEGSASSILFSTDSDKVKQLANFKTKKFSVVNKNTNLRVFGNNVFSFLL